MISKPSKRVPPPMPERTQQREAFLAACGLAGSRLSPLAGDASFRRYFRLSGAAGRWVLMDAPPEREDVRPFLQLARHLRALGYSAPEIIATDAEAGFLLLEDLGAATYTRVLAETGMEEPLYRLAMDLLIDLHRKPLAEGVPPGLPAYTDARFLEEACLLLDWYLPAVTGKPVPEKARAAYAALWPPLLAHVRSVPETLVLRDYHVDNLIHLPEREGVRACGLLDFQDAVRGPAAYDVVSLLEDARRDLSPGLVDRMCARYVEAFPALDRQAFAWAYAILGAQRNCKILGIFTRLFRRDGKSAYLAHIPRVWRLLEGDLKAGVLAPLRAWLDANLPVALRKTPEAEGG